MLQLSIDVTKKRRFLRGEHSIRLQIRLVPAAAPSDPTPSDPTQSESAPAPAAARAGSGDRNGLSDTHLSHAIPVSRLFGELMEQLPLNLPLGQDGFTHTPSVLRNLRGRPADAFHPVPPQTLAQGTEELLSASGRVICPPPIGSEPARIGADPARRTSIAGADYGAADAALDPMHDDDDLEVTPGTEIPFFVTLSTRFSEFDRGNGIVHQVMSRTSNILQSLLPRLSSGALTRIVPLKLERIRFGFESFTPRSWGMGWGGIPTVSSQLYCELTESELIIEATRDFSRNPEALPFEEHRLFQSFDRALSRLGLRHGFYEELVRNVAR